MRDPNFLQTVWFLLIGVLWIGYFVLEGFDFGVGMLLRVIARDRTEKRMIIHDQHCHFPLHTLATEIGTSTVKIVPPPALESITRVAPRMRTRSAIPLRP